MMGLLKQLMHWYIAGPLIGLKIPALLIIANKIFGVSSIEYVFFITRRS